ncbi:hypothetical protein NQ318_005818 [Aromia moschata]|uniref:Structure-specific endonuclease subunit SLX1 homolog n=1 Tax=Aromia moschata TaxID=1265417 RepID=A0AAV8YR63_9CUCU|nr:hypothetical protein NQ318_005818 [Aromia moschata]
MEEPNTVENFFGVYLLYCLNPKYKGRTYIGYTVDPNRRIKQHNKGKQYGGAWKTSNKGPWSMVMIIHGFPNDIAALRFEWAWQHPHVSRRLQHVGKKRSKEKMFDFCLRILSEMLRVGPWCRLPLTIRWLNHEFVRDFPKKLPPMHMPICHGPVVSKKLPNGAQQSIENSNCDIAYCNICFSGINGKSVKCINAECNLNSHVICLSKYFTEKGQYVPIEGECPKCRRTFLWGDIVRKYKGCYSELEVKINVDSANDFYSSDSEYFESRQTNLREKWVYQARFTTRFSKEPPQWLWRVSQVHFFFERTFDLSADIIFDKLNEGKLWKHIKDKYQ